MQSLGTSEHVKVSDVQIKHYIITCAFDILKMILQLLFNSKFIF
jgi:hypothetical protein